MATTVIEPVALQAVQDVLSHLKLAIAQLRLYPRESPQVSKVATQAYQSVVAFFECHNRLIFSTTPRGLLVNGRRLVARGTSLGTLEQALTALFAEARIKAVTIRKGLTMDELVTFLHAITHKFWDLKEGKEINKRLRSERVLSISVDEVVYVAMAQGDLLIKDAEKTLEKAGADASELLKTLDRLAESALEAGTCAEIRLKILQKLLDQDPSLLRRVRQTPGGSASIDPAGWITFENARNAVGVIVRLLGACPEGLRDELRAVGHTIINAFRNDPHLAGLMKEFLTDSAADLIPVWMKAAAQQAEKSGPVARAARILALDPDTEAEMLQREGATLVRELAALGRQDVAARIVARLAALLADRSVPRRFAAVEALLSIQPQWDAPPFSIVRGSFEALLRWTLDVEPDPRVHAKLAEMAAANAGAHLRKGEFEQALELLSTLQRHCVVKDPALPHRPEAAYRALERVVSGDFSLLSQRLRAGDPVALRVMEAFGAVGARFVVSEIRASENAQERLRLAELIARVGPAAVAVLADDLQKVTAPSDLMRLMEIIPHAAPEGTAAIMLSGFLRHPATAVRRRAATLLTERGSARGGDALLMALTDEKDPAIRVALADGLGKLRVQGAVSQLTAMAESRHESDEARAAACIALGKIGDPQAIPLLASLAVKGARGLAGMFRHETPIVRAGAIRGLGFFAPSAEAAAAVHRAVDDAEPAVKAAARDVLFAPLHRAFGDVVREVRRISAVDEVAGGNVKLAGSLSEIPLDQIFQLVASGGKSGLLMLNFDGPSARVWFERGEIGAAECEGRKDQEAVNRFITRTTGHFLFLPGEAPPERRVRIPVQQSLLEAFRRADESGPRA